jgi:NAD(P)-dependent dehydrogenase (short-subunit alcohol dehydrogenase family)
MQGRVVGKVAIVTGAGSSGAGVGTGKAIAVTLAREGACVLLADKYPERAELTLGLITESGGTGAGAVFAADISRPGDCAAMVHAAVESFGGLDILVNNAGITSHVPITQTTDELYDSIIGVNLTGSFNACKHAIPELIRRGGGSIVTIGSIAGVRDSGSTHPAYSASKAALLGLTVDLAGAYGRDNVRVNAILPGLIDTPMATGVPSSGTALSGAGVPNLLARKGDAWDIANAALFLCSDEAAYITGVMLPVDGGAIAGMPSTQLLRSAQVPAIEH